MNIIWLLHNRETEKCRWQQTTRYRYKQYTNQSYNITRYTRTKRHNTLQYTMHLPVHAVYRAVHLWWCTMLSTMRDSAAADTKQHLTLMNDIAGVSISILAISVVLL